jgi:uncharacterized protein (DUF1501 family)
MALREGIAKAASSSDRVLVSVFLEGGIDSLNVLAPTENSMYQQLRPVLRVKPGEGTEFAEDASMRWHPKAAALDTLHREGKLTVMPGVGYTNPDQSHFTSRHYWEVGQLAAKTATGWMGRLLDVIGTPDNPLQGVSLDGRLSPALATSKVPVAAVDSARYNIWNPGVWGEVEDMLFSSYARLADRQAKSKDGARSAAGTVASRAMALRDQLLPFADSDINPPVAYPTNTGDDWFGESLAALAAMLASGLPIRCAALSAPGDFDTHDNQDDDFDRILGVTADSLFAFQRDLEARGQADRVITLVWSEFGRRPEENGSRGTDHGAAGSGFLMGKRVNGTLVGGFPGLGNLDEDDNLKATSDFRGVYSALSEQWFGVDAGAVIPGAGGFARPTLIS